MRRAALLERCPAPALVETLWSGAGAVHPACARRGRRLRLAETGMCRCWLRHGRKADLPVVRSTQQHMRDLRSAWHGRGGFGHWCVSSPTVEADWLQDPVGRDALRRYLGGRCCSFSCHGGTALDHRLLLSTAVGSSRPVCWRAVRRLGGFGRGQGCLGTFHRPAGKGVGGARRSLACVAAVMI